MSFFLVLPLAFWALLFSAFPRLEASPVYGGDSTCRCLPNDPCWPKARSWAHLNRTLEGRLIATQPLGSPCHLPSFDSEQCKSLEENWNFAPVHIDDPSGVVTPVVQNGTCDPFQPKEAVCTLGNLVSFSVNVTKVKDAQIAIKFAKKNNIRLAIKNTGHDFLGRNTATGALGLWTHNLQSVSTNLAYVGPTYTGPAMKMGAGVQAALAYEEAHKVGHRVIGGSCPTVGLAGGYAQGGGHGLLTSQNGLASDSVLEWEVLTESGRLVKATPAENSDLYWALSGSGGGVFGLVISMTVKIFPETSTTGGVLAFNLTSEDAYWSAISTLLTGINPVVDSGTVALMGLTNSTFFATFTAPSVDKSTLTSQLSYITSHLNKTGVPYAFTAQSDPTYFDHFSRYFGPLPDGIWPSAHLTSSRLIPRSLFKSSNLTSSLMSEAKSIMRGNEWAIAFTALKADYSVSNTKSTLNSINPAWRDTLIQFMAYSSWDWDAPKSEMMRRADRLTNEITPRLEALTPSSGTYANEADYNYKGWERQFFGSNWDRLSKIQRSWDPEGVFYARKSVGANRWNEDSSGRLCKVA